MNQIEKYNKEKYPDEPISNKLNIRDALSILCYHAAFNKPKGELWESAHETSLAWINNELQEKDYKQALADRVASKHGILADAHMEERYPRTGGLGETGPRN